MDIQPEHERAAERARRTGIKLFLTLPILSWALYDFANTIFSSNIVTIFFPFYLQEIVGENASMNQVASTFISYSNAAASFLLVIFTPLFGVLIDRTGRKKRYIGVFTLISVACTILMGVFAGLPFQQTVYGLPLSLILVVVMFVTAKFFYHSSLVFYDTILADLGTKEEIPLLSGFGIAVGYIGTLVGLTVYLMVGNHDFHQAFIPSALLFLLFSLPYLIFTKERRKPEAKEKKSFFSGYREIMRTFKDIRLYRPVFLFMIAYFFLNDALATAVAMMAVYSKTIIGFTTGQFILLYLVSTASSIIGSFLLGYVTKRIGAKKAVSLVAAILIIALTIAVFTSSAALFWFAGSLFGIALGGTWVASRTLIIELTPEHKRGEFFGLFALSGKISSIFGPLLYGSITLMFKDLGNTASRMAFGSLILLAAIGLIIHQNVKAKA
ncbi:MFS transporter [Bacillus swezeyi]|uniref:MFS transporter n=1 Tax=Bacillus swezeyi TaxID=1925020 RepID=A0A1R1QKK3_9BACI|nr:MFS transporter [Bacillus swezeyi]MEC1262338.1 MFS transporter [Bacillus swezeyi]MED2926953.1 MFS transporter [Bacillus swezeyi]MED2943269.1 MFS transporter [Bacillus swezeyi]MED2965485.1 MFS transporter [Bacillus swezeyi]MED2978104.1 MFS transporter [Bacillus swezeyi]